MWHIPIKATERTLLYAAETFEQFEGLLQLFERLDNEDNFDWWEEMANDLKASGNASSDSYNEEFDGYNVKPERKNNEPKEIVIMEPKTAINPGTEESFIIERDMRVSVRPQKGGKMSVQEYVEGMVAGYPMANS